MKCNVCGKEFGNGAYCQNCGSDIITARGNYSSGGYSTPESRTGYSASTPSQNIDANNSNINQHNVMGNMICYKCSEVIPDDSVYCPYCRTKLFETCPKCGHKYPSQYKICNMCGTDRDEYLEEQKKLEQQKQELLRKQQEEERQRQLEEQRRLELQRQEQLRKQQEEERLRQLEAQREKERQRLEIERQKQLKDERLRYVRRAVSGLLLLLFVLYSISVSFLNIWGFLLFVMWISITIYWYRNHKL